MRKININAISMFLVNFYIFSLLIFAYDEDTNVILHMIAIILYAFGVLYACYNKEKAFEDTRIYISFFLIIFLSCLSVLWSANPDSAIDATKTVFLLSLLAVSIYNIVNTRKKILNVINAYIFSVYIMFVYYICSYGINNIINLFLTGGRIGDITQINAFGLYSSIAFIICMFKAINTKKYLYYILAIMPLLMAIASGSRKSLLILILSVPLLSVINSKGKILINIIFSILIIYGIYYIFESMGVLENVFVRTFDFFAEKKDTSSNIRIGFLEYGWGKFLDNPLIGYGVEQFQELLYRDTGARSPAHNNYMQILISFGMIGFTIWYSMYYYIIKNIIGRVFKDKLCNLIFIIFVCLLVSDLSTSTLNDKFTYVFLAVGFSLVRVIKSEEDKYQNENF